MNYKAIDLNILDEEESFRDWLWDKTPYWIRKFIRKFRRWWKYTKHLWKENPWNEDHELYRIIQLQLSIMADEFNNRSITLSAKDDARDMRKVICLLSRYMDEHYSTKYYNEGVIEPDSKTFEEWINTPTKFNKGYDQEGLSNSYEQDRKCLDLAMKLIAHKAPGWWQ